MYYDRSRAKKDSEKRVTPRNRRRDREGGNSTKTGNPGGSGALYLSWN